MDAATLRVRGALQLARTAEPFDVAVDESAIRPAMDMDDTLAQALARRAEAGARARQADAGGERRW